MRGARAVEVNGIDPLTREGELDRIPTHPREGIHYQVAAAALSDVSCENLGSDGEPTLLKGQLDIKSELPVVLTHTHTRLITRHPLITPYSPLPAWCVD